MLAAAPLVVTLLMPVSAHAAVRLCERMVSSGPRTASSEAEARRSALAAWLAEANTFGVAYTRWLNAQPHLMTCTRTPAGFACAASGRPCRIKQVQPPGTTRIPRGNASEPPSTEQPKTPTINPRPAKGLSI